MAHDWPGNVRELRNVVTRLVLFPDFALEALGAGLKPPAASAVPAAGEGGAPAPASPPTLSPSTLPSPAAAASPSGSGPEAAPRALPDDLGPLINLPLREAKEMLLEQFERRYLAQKLREHGGNISRTADAIGLSRQSVHRLIDRYGLRDVER
jgi:DNA-binding NtrC family response regulator